MQPLTFLIRPNPQPPTTTCDDNDDHLRDYLKLYGPTAAITDLQANEMTIDCYNRAKDIGRVALEELDPSSFHSHTAPVPFRRLSWGR